MNGGAAAAANPFTPHAVRYGRPFSRRPALWTAGVLLAVLSGCGLPCFGQPSATMTAGQSELLRKWTDRFHADRQQWLRDPSARQNLFLHLTIQDGLIFLNDFAAARQLQQQDPARAPDDHLQQTIDALARIDRVAEALAMMDQFQRPVLRGQALRMLANYCSHRGDVDKALQLVEQAESERRDRMLSDVVYTLLEKRDIDHARRIMVRIKDEDILKVLKPILERESRRPQVTEPGFVQRNVDWKWEGIWQIWQDSAEIRARIGNTHPEPHKPRMVAMLTHVSSAMLAQHERQTDRCLAELTKARDLAREYPTEDEQVRELLSLAALAHRLEQDKLAREILLETTRNPKSDDYLTVSMHGLPPMDAVAALLTADEVQPLLDRWQQDELPMDLIGYVEALGRHQPFALGRHQPFARLDTVHAAMKSVTARLIVDVTVLELLLRKSREK